MTALGIGCSNMDLDLAAEVQTAGEDAQDLAELRSRFIQRHLVFHLITGRCHNGDGIIHLRHKLVLILRDCCRCVCILCGIAHLGHAAGGGDCAELIDRAAIRRLSERQNDRLHFGMACGGSHLSAGDAALSLKCAAIRNRRIHRRPHAIADTVFVTDKLRRHLTAEGEGHIAMNPSTIGDYAVSGRLSQRVVGPIFLGDIGGNAQFGRIDFGKDGIGLSVCAAGSEVAHFVHGADLQGVQTIDQADVIGACRAVQSDPICGTVELILHVVRCACGFLRDGDSHMVCRIPHAGGILAVTAGFGDGGVEIRRDIRLGIGNFHGGRGRILLIQLYSNDLS